MREDRELTFAVQRNPWARAVWERKHPDGPVLVIWQLAPLLLFVAGWIKIAGNRCMPALVSFAAVDNVANIDSTVDLLGENAFAAGPSGKMVAQSKSIQEKYVANGAKGGRPPSRRNGAAKQIPSAQVVASVPVLDVESRLDAGPERNDDVWVWRKPNYPEFPNAIWEFLQRHDPNCGFLMFQNGPDRYAVRIRSVDKTGRITATCPLVDSGTIDECFDAFGVQRIPSKSH